MKHNLYIHVPFCAAKCNYCAFYSEAANGDLINQYVDALIVELGMVAADLRPKTIFFGGGTPSLLNLSQWERLLGAMDRLNLLGAEEWTVECNPATISSDKAKLLRSFGVNRISMGVQSLNENLLDRLGRVHSREMVFKSYDCLRKAGFENINLDLMFAIPSQTMQVWDETLREAIALQSEHLSCYEVIYEEDTALFAQLKAGQFSVDEDLACAMYEELVRHAAESGFQQYEIANFAKHNSQEAPPSDDVLPSFACQHNVNYWRGGMFYGLGPSATGYIDGCRTKNLPNTKAYCEQLNLGKRPIESMEILPPLRRAGETAAFGLRMNLGWSFERFLETTRFDLRETWKAEMEELCSRGWALVDDRSFRLTSKGLRFADAAAEAFLK